MKLSLHFFAIPFLTGQFASAGDLTQPVSRVTGAEMKAATPAYRQAAFDLILREANHYAARLKLPERLPITSNGLVEVRIATPWLERKFGMLGSIRTENFFYGVAKGNRLVYIPAKRRHSGSMSHTSRSTCVLGRS